MTGTSKKAEVPACACGKVDLYEEWVKQNADKKNKIALNPTNQVIDQLGCTDAAGKGETKLIRTKA